MKKRTLTLILSFFTILSLYRFTAFSSSNIGTTILPVVIETRSVRSTALGKTFVSNSQNAGSVFEGSVGLCSIDSAQVSFFYNRSYADVGLGYLAFAYPFRKISLGLGVLNMQTDTFDTIILVEDEKTQQTSEERSFVRGQSDWIYNLGTGIEFSRKFHFGFNIKFYNSTLIEKYTASGFVYDLGTKFSISNFDFGFSFNNIGQETKYLQEKFNLPQQTQIGISFNTRKEKFYHNFNVAIEYETRTYEEINFLHSGIEWSLPSGWIHPISDVSVRAGYVYDISENVNNRLSCGFGIEFSSILIEYSFVPHSKLGTSNYFSITYKFPAGASEAKEIEKPESQPEW